MLMVRSNISAGSRKEGTQWTDAILRTKKERPNYVLFSCEGARDTEDRLFIVYSGASVHNAEQGQFSSDTVDTLRRSKHHKRLTATGDNANKRVSTSFCSWSRYVRNSAITRWNASDSIASSVLLKTRTFIWVENRWNSTIGQKWEDNYLYNGQLSTSRCVKIVIIFQQRFVFNIEMKGSV